MPGGTAVGEGWQVTCASPSMFMHGSWLHLIGNMLFLWIFGNNVEDALGKVRFLAFYLLAGFAATALQTVVTLAAGTDMAAAVPNIGASGAVSGVLGAYLVFLPTAKVLTLVFYFLLEVPAFLFLGFWFLSSSGKAGSRSPSRRSAGASRSSRMWAASSSVSLTVRIFMKRPPVTAGLLMEPRSSRSTSEPRWTCFPRRSPGASRTSRS